MSNKQNVINKINNMAIAPQKSDPVANSSGTKFDALMQYNAMLDNITIGAHTSTIINFAGIDWKVRLLTADEFINIRKSIVREMESEKIFEDFLSAYLMVLKTLSLALTPTPFKTDGEGAATEFLTEQDLRLINYDILENVYTQYLDFVIVATKKPTDMTDEEIIALMDIVKKKPEVLVELERPKLLTITRSLLSSCANMEKMLKSDTSN